MFIDNRKPYFTEDHAMLTARQPRETLMSDRAPLVPDETDEDRLIALLATHHQLRNETTSLAVSLGKLANPRSPAEMAKRDQLVREHTDLNLRRKEVGDEIGEIIDTYFRRSIRPMLTKVFGAKVVGQTDANNGALQFTAMVSEFFVKVLQKRPDAFWKAQTAHDLRTWASVVIANQMRTYLKRKQRGQQILAEIAPLVAQRQSYFEDRYAMTFEDFLNLLATKEADGDSSQQLAARAWRHRYVDGMKWGDIAQDLGISDDTLLRIRKDAESQLKKKL